MPISAASPSDDCVAAAGLKPFATALDLGLARVAMTSAALRSAWSVCQQR